jgi:hypothetical protein
MLVGSCISRLAGRTRLTPAGCAVGRGSSPESGIRRHVLPSEWVAGFVGMRIVTPPGRTIAAIRRG